MTSAEPTYQDDIAKMQGTEAARLVEKVRAEIAA